MNRLCICMRAEKCKADGTGAQCSHTVPHEVMKYGTQESCLDQLCMESHADSKCKFIETKWDD